MNSGSAWVNEERKQLQERVKELEKKLEAEVDKPLIYLEQLENRVKELEELLCTCCKIHGCPIDPECPIHTTKKEAQL